MSNDQFRRIKITHFPIPFPSTMEYRSVVDQLQPTQINPNQDIRLVMTQAHVSKDVAVQMLQKHQGDIVMAILDLT